MDLPSPFDKLNLVLAATPIGNVGDSTPRLRVALTEAELVACEDTRRLRDLARRLKVEVSAKLLAYHEHNESELTARLLEVASNGTKVLQVSDAGMPGISDPGFRLAREASAAGIPFTVLPGPSAPLLALVASGLPTDSFRFLGFLPRKTITLEQTLQSMVREPETLIVLESPRRTLETLASLETVFGPDRPAAVARELTKTHEEVLRGSLRSVRETLENRGEVLGEIVIVVGGFNKGLSGNEDVPPALLDKLEQLVQNGLRAKTAAKLLADWFDSSAKQLYETHLKLSVGK